MPAREVGVNGKTYAEAFAKFENEVLDVLDMRRSSEKFKSEVLARTVLWHPGGFFGVRYTSGDAAKRLPGVKVKRDHVHTRRKLVQRILAGHDLQEVFEQAGTMCYVTDEEHRRLSKFDKTHGGWDRYAAAGVVWCGLQRVSLPAPYERPAHQRPSLSPPPTRPASRERPSATDEGFP